MSSSTTQLKIFPFAKLQAFQFGLIGLLAGLVYSVGGLFYDLISTGSLNAGSALAVLALLGMPVIFALGGWVLGLVGAWLYNQFSRPFSTLFKDLEIFDD